MAEKNNEIKQKIQSIINSATDMDDALNELGNLLLTLKPIENADEINLVCDASIICANKIDRTEMIAQYYFMKARAEMTKPSMYIHEMKNLTMGLGWFGHALKIESNRHKELDEKVNNHWSTIQSYINTGFEYLDKKPYVGPVAYCYQTAGEIYASFYLQLMIYGMGSGKPWRSAVANKKITRFLNLDIFLLLDKTIRERIKKIKKDCFKYLKLSSKYYRKEEAWKFLADCYLTIALEHHSFNSPLRSKLAILKAENVIKKHKISGLEDRVRSMKTLPLIGSARD